MAGEAGEFSIVSPPERELRNSILLKAGLAVVLGGLLSGSGRAILIGEIMIAAAILWTTRPDKVY